MVKIYRGVMIICHGIKKILNNKGQLNADASPIFYVSQTVQQAINRSRNSPPHLDHQNTNTNCEHHTLLVTCDYLPYQSSKQHINR